MLISLYWKIWKIGHDGKEILPSESPQVNGYGFMGTPSPAPGVDESPLMTWGEIESTPFRLQVLYVEHLKDLV
jgi:protein DGCR14